MKEIFVNEKNKCPLNSTISKVSTGAIEFMEIYKVKNPEEFFRNEKKKNDLKVIGTGYFQNKKNKNLSQISFDSQKVQN